MYLNTNLQKISEFYYSNELFILFLDYFHTNIILTFV